MKKFLLIGVILLAVVILSGCQNAVEKATETVIESTTNNAVDVDVDNNSMTINTNDSSLTVGDTATIPADFPSDVYVISGEVKSSLTMDENSTFQIQIESEESYADTVAKYKEQLESDGWNITSSLEVGEATTMMSEKDDRNTSVTISEADGVVTLMLTTSIEAE